MKSALLVVVGYAVTSLSIPAQSKAQSQLDSSAGVQHPIAVSSEIQHPVEIPSGTQNSLRVAPVAASPQKVAANQARVGVASDWTHSHVLYPTPKSLGLAIRFQNDPRYMQSWYLRHREIWWPRAGHGRLRPSSFVQRDWSETLGTTSTNGIPTFEPLFDFNYSLSGGFETGAGTLNSFDLLAAHEVEGGAFWATNGSVTVTTGDGTGTYALSPGGPATETQIETSGNYNYNNVLFPGYPAVAPIFTGFDGVSFGNATDNLLFVESGGDVFNTWWTGGNAAGTFPGAPGTNINTDPGGGQTMPAKYTFDVTAMPSCTGDFVAVGIPANAVTGTQANIVGYNNLYTPTDGTSDTCTGSGPNVMFSYASGTGEVPGSVALSLDGTQLAYVEDQLTGISVFHVLTIGTNAGSEGTSPTSPVTPGASGSNAVDTSLTLAGGSGSCPTQSSTTSPYIDYADNAAYVTTYAWTGAGVGAGCVYRIDNVFGDTGPTVPTIAWSIQTTAVPSSPVADAITHNVFFTDSNGNIDVISDTGTPSSYASLTVAAGATSENPVIIDNTNGMVYATFNTNGTNAVVVQAPESLASSVSAPVGLGDTFFTGPYDVDFSNAWYTGGPTMAGALLYVAGNDTTTGTVPTLYSVAFGGVTAGVMNTMSASSTALATATNAATTHATVADASGVTEFFNASTSTDYLFVGVTDSCEASTGGGNAGCVMSLNITSGAPTVSATTTAIAAPGGSTGIIIDNDADPPTNPQASSVYYGTKNGGTLVKATQNGLN